MLFIQSVKIGVVMKPYHKAGLSDGVLASDEIVANVQSAHDQIIIGRNAHIIFEKVGDVVF